MPAQAPQYTIAKPPSGILPISGATTQNTSQVNGAPNKASSKAQEPKSKVVIRRLPPGLTQAEFENQLGEEWKPGNGKIGWSSYKPGKVVKDLAKPSRPARAYLQVADQTHLGALANKVRTTSFTDALNTSNDAVLIGLPALEFAPYTRTPTMKKRLDTRQGTIDQDPEYMEFLTSLTDPIERPPTIDNLPDGANVKPETPTETPLIAFLRKKKAEKEAAKAEKSAQSKGGKHSRQSSKADVADNKNDGKATAQSGKNTAEAADKKVASSTKGSKAIKETVKVTKKENPASSAAKVQPAPTGKTEPGKPPRDASTRKQEPSAAARMIQRDLGLRGGRGGSRRGGAQSPDARRNLRGGDASSDVASPIDTDKAKAGSDVETSSTTGNATKPSQTPPKGPTNPNIIVKRSTSESTNKQQAPASPLASTSTSTPATAQTPTAPKGQAAKPKPAPAVTPTATRGFLKHANPSQGITEPLLKEVLTPYGTVVFCEIDKRKGFAYVDFAEPEGLQKAIAASPVKVAQGSVVVLERKDRTPAAVVSAGATGAGRGGNASVPSGPARGASTGPGFRGGRGGSVRGRGNMGRGGGHVANASAPTATPAPTTPSEPGSTNGG